VSAPTDPDATASLPDEAIIVRGGLSLFETLRESAKDHHGHILNSEQREEWALSFASLPGIATLEEIAREAAAKVPDFADRKRLRTARVGRLRALGYSVELDRPPHGLIIFPNEPSNDELVAVEATFAPAQLNPAYGGGKK
jgi:hypothetical protein